MQRCTYRQIAIGRHVAHNGTLSSEYLDLLHYGGGLWRLLNVIVGAGPRIRILLLTPEA